ncbi:MAG TPA: arsinothricin resistance N-acetyltransferase ArsN1 family B [Herpetosiphonaceae bacterium]
MKPAIRLATPEDAEQMLAIYAPLVATTSISFELEPPTIDQMRQRIRETLERWPWVSCEDQEAIVGYAYAGQHRRRAAYQWSVDVSVYVHERARRMGIGQALYTSLFNILVLQGFYNAYAGIALPNRASVRLHESLGFKPVGVYHGVGYKLGAWHDVGWWQRTLQPRRPDPQPPCSLDAARADPAWAAVLASGVALLRFEL